MLLVQVPKIVLQQYRHECEVPEIEVDVRLSGSIRRVLGASKTSRMTDGVDKVGDQRAVFPVGAFDELSSLLTVPSDGG